MQRNIGYFVNCSMLWPRMSALGQQTRSAAGVDSVSISVALLFSAAIGFPLLLLATPEYFYPSRREKCRFRESDAENHSDEGCGSTPGCTGYEVGREIELIRFSDKIVPASVTPYAPPVSQTFPRTRCAGRCLSRSAARSSFACASSVLRGAGWVASKVRHSSGRVPRRASWVAQSRTCDETSWNNSPIPDGQSGE